MMLNDKVEKFNFGGWNFLKSMIWIREVFSSFLPIIVDHPHPQTFPIVLLPLFTIIQEWVYQWVGRGIFFPLFFCLFLVRWGMAFRIGNYRTKKSSPFFLPHDFFLLLELLAISPLCTKQKQGLGSCLVELIARKRSLIFSLLNGSTHEIVSGFLWMKRIHFLARPRKLYNISPFLLLCWILPVLFLA